MFIDGDAVENDHGHYAGRDSKPIVVGVASCPLLLTSYQFLAGRYEFLVAG